MENSNAAAKIGASALADQRMRTFVLSLAIVSIPLLTLLDLLHGPRWSVWGLGLACAAFVVLQMRQVPAATRRTSLVLALAAGALLPFIEQPIQVLERGVRIGGLIASLLLTVNLLSRAALRVPRVHQVVGGLYQLPAGQRYPALAVASQFFGGLLGLAGIAMMMEMAARQERASDAEKISSFCAISRGYAALSLWSPMYSNMSIVLALYQGPSWVSVLPYALIVSGLLIALGALLDRLGRSGSHASPREPGQVSAAPLLRAALPVIVCMLGFVAFMVVTSQHLDVPIPAVIIASAPLAAWLLNTSLAGHTGARIKPGARLLAKDFFGFSAMAGEVMLFLASACAGTVMASAIPPAWIVVIGQVLGGSPFLGYLFLSSGIVLLSATAIHPMLSAILIASSFTPQLLGLPVIAHLCAVLVGWGLAITVTPFSVISLMASRFSGIPLLVISLRANLLYVALSVLLSALVLGGITQMTQS